MNLEKLSIPIRSFNNIGIDKWTVYQQSVLIWQQNHFKTLCFSSFILFYRLISLFNRCNAQPKLMPPIRIKIANTKSKSFRSILPYRIKVRKALIAWVNGLRLMILPKIPWTSSTGNRAVLRKNIGSTIAFITVS